MTRRPNEHYVPYVVEPSLGADRVALAFLCDAYDEEVVDAEKNDTRVVLRLHPGAGPLQGCGAAAVQEAGETTPSRCTTRLAKHFMVDYDDAGSIGKRYRRQDEIGTPFCITYRL